MKSLADENVKSRLCLWLMSLGHDVLAADKGVKNSRLFSLANKEHRVLVTNDTDFLNTALYPPHKTHGRIVLRIFPSTLENQKTSMETLLRQFNDSESFNGKLIELWNTGFEARTK